MVVRDNDSQDDFAMQQSVQLQSPAGVAGRDARFGVAGSTVVRF